MDTNTPSSVDELYVYLSNLESSNKELAAEVSTLRAEILKLNRSLGAYKANATRRRKAAMTVSA